jgi:predicted ester cyclase
MSTESIARDLIANMTNIEKIKTMVTPDAMASGGVLPMTLPIMEAMKVTAGLSTAFPDFKIDIQQVTVNGNQATLQIMWSGTNNGPLNLGIPGMPAIPATGKKVSVKDAFIVTVMGDKVSHFEVNSPSDGGIPAALMQLGVQMPSM